MHKSQTDLTTDWIGLICSRQYDSIVGAIDSECREACWDIVIIYMYIYRYKVVTSVSLLIQLNRFIRSFYFRYVISRYRYRIIALTMGIIEAALPYCCCHVHSFCCFCLFSSPLFSRLSVGGIICVFFILALSRLIIKQ